MAATEASSTLCQFGGPIPATDRCGPSPRSIVPCRTQLTNRRERRTTSIKSDLPRIVARSSERPIWFPRPENIDHRREHIHSPSGRVAVSAVGRVCKTSGRAGKRDGANRAPHSIWKSNAGHRSRMQATPCSVAMQSPLTS